MNDDTGTAHGQAVSQGHGESTVGIVETLTSLVMGVSETGSWLNPTVVAAAVQGGLGCLG